MLDRAIGIFRRMGFALAEGPDIETNGIASMRSTPRPIIRPATSRIHSICPTAGCSGRTLRPCKFARWKLRHRRFASSRRVPLFGAMKSMRLTARNSIRSKGFTWTKKSASRTSRAHSNFFCESFSAPDTPVRFRPHYFPFTEPSFEIDVKSKALKGGEKWIEVCGCGMVHPAVYEEVNRARGDNAYDPEKWSGFAFGLGMDRLAMILFGIPDIRLFAQNDLRFLRQFA